MCSFNGPSPWAIFLNYNDCVFFPRDSDEELAPVKSRCLIANQSGHSAFPSILRGIEFNRVSSFVGVALKRIAVQPWAMAVP